MVKLIALFAFVAVSAGYVSADYETSTVYFFSNELLAQVKEVLNKCNEEYGPFDEIYTMVRQRQYSTDEDFKKVISCVYNGTGFTEDTGNLKVADYAANFPDDAYDQIAACNELTADTAVETTNSIFVCLLQKLPYTLGV